MDREVIIPEEMREIVSRAGYAPAVKVGDTIYVVGQVGRTRDLQVIEDPQEQFRAIWENLRIVLEAADCTFDDVVEMTSYHVEMSQAHGYFPDGKERSLSKRNLRIGLASAYPNLPILACLRR